MAFLTGYAFALVMVLRSPHASTHRYGAILLAALLLWAYIHAKQYIVIWSGNIQRWCSGAFGGSHSKQC